MGEPIVTKAEFQGGISTQRRKTTETLQGFVNPRVDRDRLIHTQDS